MRNLGNLLTPEGFIMMGIAILLDLAGLLLLILSFLGIGVPFSWILDASGLLTIGLWMFFRSGSFGSTKKASKVSQKALKKLGIGIIGEVIPFVGDLAPCWTWMVFSELTSQ